MTLTIALELFHNSSEESDRLTVREAAAAVSAHYNSMLGILLEHNSADAKHRNWPETRLLNPGHSIEAGWLLIRASEVLGDESILALGGSIIHNTLELAWDTQYGGISYLIDIEGRPCQQLEAPMKLWWSHAEALYAVILAYNRLGDSRMMAWRELVSDYIFDRFVDREHGEWFGYLDRRGIPTSYVKGGSYKGFYHVPRALLFSLQELRR
jgi:N-acylglucosamine 2-epimerase